MNTALEFMRRFSIRTRMRGAVGMVMATLALVGFVGVVGGAHLRHLNQDFMAHSIQESESVSTLRQHMAKVRLLEKSMVIDYEDGVAVLKHAAGKQSQGISQVNSAVARLDGMTQQNASLVQQSAAAAESLKEQAQRLGTVVGAFRLQSQAV